MFDPRDHDPPADAVQAQYERWVYPPKEYDLAAMPLTNPEWHYGDLRNLWPLFWPDRPYREDIDILVAGCGSVAAAAQAYLYPKARIVGIDVSRASLAHHEFLKNKHHLTNLVLHHCPLERVASLNATFDHIICYGVLHHTANPTAGLRALGEVLRPDGVIDIMLYGKHGRVGVTMLQELFRTMGLNQDENGVRLVKETLALLSPNHPVHNYRRLASADLASDEGLVDTFLHPRDVPFSVGDCLDLTRDAGLIFQGWKENGVYNVDARLDPQVPLRRLLDSLDDRHHWEAVELIDASIPGHWFHVCRPDRDPATYVIHFAGDAFLDYVPLARVGQSAPAHGQLPATISRPPFPTIGLSDQQALLFSQVNGVRSVRECLAAAGAPPNSPQAIDAARQLFQFLWRIGYAMFQLP